MPTDWVDPDVGFAVLVSTAGPLDPPDSGTTFNLTDHAGVNYVRGDPGISIRRGRSDEFESFQAGTCTLTLNNNNREFDPNRALVALDLPGVAGATASTPDDATFNVTDLDVRARLSADDWTPGGFGKIIASQWGSAANEGWVFSVNATGNITLTFTSDGSTDQQRTSTVVPLFTDGSDHWVRATLDVNNGAAGHDVKFYTSTDGVTWAQLGATVTTAGTTSIFNSTANLVVGDLATATFPFAGQVRYFEVRNGIDGPIVARPDFAAQEPDTTSFIDDSGRTWTVNGTARIVYDDNASVFAPILKPRRRVTIVTGHSSDLSTLTILFVGFIEGWPQTWTKTTGSVELVAHDLLSVLAQSQSSPALNVLILDDPLFGQLDRWPLAGDLPEQFTGERIGSLIGFAGLSSTAIQTGTHMMMGLEPSGDVLSLCQEAELLEAGFLFVDRNGTITFYDRHSRFRNSRLADVQAVFTDAQYSGLSIDYGLAQMWNDVRCTMPDQGESGTMEHIAVDDASIAEFGRRVHTESLPFVSHAEAESCALFFLDRYKLPKQRPTPVTIKPRLDVNGLFLKIARRELLDRIQLVRTPLGVGLPIVFTGLIEQLEHRITNVDWECTIGISPIDADTAQNYLILDDVTLGQLDEELLAF